MYSTTKHHIAMNKYRLGFLALVPQPVEEKENTETKSADWAEIKRRERGISEM